MKKINFSNVNLLISAGRPDQFPSLPLPCLAMSGRSNVGKSSLINKILGRKSLARVSSSPGKTITVNFYNVDGAFLLADLPGYGFARRTDAERRALSKITDAFFTNNKQIDRLSLVFQLIDPRAGITADDETMLGYLNALSIPYCVVVTKTDKLNKTELTTALAEITAHPLLSEAEGIFGAPIEVIPYSSLSGAGCDAVRGRVFDIVK